MPSRAGVSPLVRYNMTDPGPLRLYTVSEGLVCTREPSGENHCPILKVVLSVKQMSDSVGPIWLAETMALLGRLRESDCSVIPTTSSGEKEN